MHLYNVENRDERKGEGLLKKAFADGKKNLYTDLSTEAGFKGRASHNNSIRSKMIYTLPT